MARNSQLDNPVEAPAEDEFNRWPFSQRLADTIAGFDTSQGAPVLGLFGRWGYGKSTVLNFLRVALEQNHSGKVTVFVFNPWLFKEQEALLREFYAGLARTIGADFDKSGKDLGEWMKRYGGAFSSLPFVGGSVSKTIEAFGNDLAKDPTPDQRERLTIIMRAAPKKVVVLIDDLDRLDHEEVMTMLKLVRLSANFPNVIYLLAFDEERIARVAGNAYGDPAEGRQFLEKIIQYPFSLPAVGLDRLAKYVMRHAQSACMDAGIELSEKAWSEYYQVCRELFLPHLGTPRQAIRYANALRFALPMLRGEVDPFDQMIVEATRVLFPQLYKYLRDNVDFIVNPPRDLPANEELVAGPLIKVLTRYNRDTSKIISDPRYHGRYFSYAVAPDDISDADLELLLKISGDGDDTNLEPKLRELAKDRLASLTERLSSRGEGLDVDRAYRLATTLARLGDVLPTDQALHEQPRAVDLAGLIAHLANHLLDIQAFRSTFVAPDVLRSAVPLPFALLIFNELGRVDRQEEKKHGPPQDWEGLRAMLKERVKTDAIANPPYNRYTPLDAYRMLYFWRSSDLDEQKAWLTERLRSQPREVSRFLGMFSDMMVNYQYIVEFVEPENIVTAITGAFGDTLSNLERRSDDLDNARAFLSEYRRRSMATSEANS